MNNSLAWKDYQMYLREVDMYSRAIAQYEKLDYSIKYFDRSEPHPRDYPRELRILAGPTLIYEIPPRRSALHFVESDDDHYHETTIPLSLPYLYLVCSNEPGHGLYSDEPFVPLKQVFCRSRELTCTTDLLYHLPLSHISETGSICVGDGGMYNEPHTTYSHILESAYRDFLFTKFYRYVRDEARLYNFPDFDTWVENSQNYDHASLNYHYAASITAYSLICENEHESRDTYKTLSERLIQYKEIVDTYAYKFKDELAGRDRKAPVGRASR